MPFDPAASPLSPSQARVLATLMEKARTVPDSYPMSLNGLLTGCNQKTSRDPVMALSEAQVQEALAALERLALVFENSSYRSPRWEHNFQRGAGVPEQSAVLLGLLMLRGPQTAAELRTNAERWYRFADISSVEAFLDELQQRSADKGGPLAVPLPRSPGMREQRWAHLLCGPVDAGRSNAGVEPVPAGVETLQERIGTLESELASLRATVQWLCQELGITPAPASMPPPGLPAGNGSPGA
ncbi:YceH family protein [Verminephrobacter eiseniae]|uniref:YceH family protein n=1 Tax=Verminephrobacter eiseniae TaxID=364317 RepID=UPI00223731F9|nr:YceH family protein [Verminephrobacter eiseniae]MCW5229908.1 DUF480 domain-containing protein [Verminephrobacter eiseniae]MCW5291640.1 DUF480 domain-containing protein [Verminephrobacter eiseniae]MCW8184737.1 DUF480 domain-containing protein [Verminephrobacter eiseniae]MCW8223576.1 DUF480 domain-containing protein [Verminephrobacter eiseniae]MCW8234575.1 DUF480 domain-containing protein [Verminephrobacter eiseniae]